MDKNTNEKSIGGATEGLPESTRLLLDFARYCEIKQKCSDMHSDEQGAPSCRASGGECTFENCPKLRGA